MSQNDQYLTLSSCGEEHALPVLRVREIIEYETVTKVPSTPAHVRGVINLRGAVLPVIDLAARFGRGESTPQRTTCIVVVEARLGEELVCVGLMADAVSQVVDLPPSAIAPPPPFGAHAPIDYLVGMGKLDGRLLLVLDLDRLLCEADVVVPVDPPAAGDAPPAAELVSAATA